MAKAKIVKKKKIYINIGWIIIQLKLELARGPWARSEKGVIRDEYDNAIPYIQAIEVLTESCQANVKDCNWIEIEV